MFKRIALVTLLAATTAITGCANSDVYSGDVYTKDRAKQVQTVSYGTILSTRPVKIQADENSLIGTCLLYTSGCRSCCWWRAPSPAPPSLRDRSLPPCR